MRNKNKFDPNKAFVMVSSKAHFDNIQTREQLYDEQTLVVPHKKEEIPVPVVISNIERVTVPKQFAKITPNYIRLPPHLNLPNQNKYELSQVDHIFLQSHRDKFIHKGKIVLTQKFLQECIVQLQKRAGKDMILPRHKGWMMAFLEKHYRQLLEMNNIQVFAQKIYNYWKNRRQELCFPLLRALWRGLGHENIMHTVTYRPRYRPKRHLRRTTRMADDQITQELYSEFDLALKISERVRVRQELKLKVQQLSTAAFYSELKQWASPPSFVEEFRAQQKAKHEQIMVRLSNQLDVFSKGREGEHQIEEPIKKEVDTQQSLVNFLSTVVYEAQLLGLNYENLYTMPTISSHLAASSVTASAEDKDRSTDNSLSVSLRRLGDSRVVQNEVVKVSERRQPGPARDYLQLKRQRVDLCYFGSDDEGDTKDLKRTISISFKKFMQMQQISRNSTAPVSEN